MVSNTLAHALASLVSVRRRTSLADAPTCLAAATLRHSLAHGSACTPAAQSLRDRPKAARLCYGGVAGDLKCLTYLRGMSNNTL